jgi:hypothetical protein
MAEFDALTLIQALVMRLDLGQPLSTQPAYAGFEGAISVSLDRRQVLEDASSLKGMCGP